MNSRQILFVGTYTQAGSVGIYRFEFLPESATLKPLGEPTPLENPSFLELHPRQDRLYVVSETNDYEGEKSGSVAAYQITNLDGELKFLNQVSTRGGSPCHLTLPAEGTAVLVANYSGGNVVSLPLTKPGLLQPVFSNQQHAGSSVNPQRQRQPHAHSVNLSADDRFAYAADLGADKIFIYRFNHETGALTPNDPPSVPLPPGSGPRHLAFHPEQPFVYCCNELTSTVSAFRRDTETGALKLLQTLSTLPDDFTGNNGTAEIRIHPSGKFLFVSNRGHHSLAKFEIDPATGQLTASGHTSTAGSTPRNFNFDLTGRFLLAANQDSNNLVLFRVDDSGELKSTGVDLEIPRPVCLRFWQPCGDQD